MTEIEYIKRLKRIIFPKYDGVKTLTLLIELIESCWDAGFCFNCLQPCDDMFYIIREESLEYRRIGNEMPVPYCRRCKREFEKKNRLDITQHWECKVRTDVDIKLPMRTVTTNEGKTLSQEEFWESCSAKTLPDFQLKH